MAPPSELCFGCMEARDSGEFCPRCGYQHGSQPTSAIYLVPGTVLQDQYVIGRTLGHGGFGVTYLGFDSVLQRKIAVKEYLPASLASRRTGSAHLSVHYDKLRDDFDFGLQRFLDEARTLARFHAFPNIIWVMNFFPANGTAYMVMEYLEGETFEAYLGRHGGRISFAACLAILTPVMDALREVHRQNLLHRDISPDNIFVLNAGPVKLLDFGAARFAMSMRSRALSVIVKEGYAPEEQYSSSGEQGPWTDVYALGGTMYRALTGRIPASSLERRRSDQLTPPSLLGADIPPACEQVLLRALAVDAAQRFPSVEEFQTALQWGAGETVRLPISQTRTPIVSPTSPTLPLATIPLPSTAGPPVPEPAGRPHGSPRNVALLAIAVIVLIGLGYAAYRNASKKHVDVISFSAADSSVAFGAMTTLTWQVNNADRVFIVPAPGQVPSSGSAQVVTRQTTTYHLTAIGPDGKSVERTLQIVVMPAAIPPPAPRPVPVPPHREPAPVPPVPAPLKIAFTAQPARVHPGQAAILHWELENATSADIQPSVGALTKLSGRLRVEPTATTTYRLTARSANGTTASSLATVEVLNEPSPAPGPHGNTGKAPQPPQLPVADPSKNQFLVIHSHAGAGRLLNSGAPAGYCTGVLEVKNGRVTYRVTSSSDQRRDDFDEPLSLIVEARKNRLDIHNRPAFHIRFQDGHNYNFEPQNASVAQILGALFVRAKP